MLTTALSFLIALAIAALTTPIVRDYAIRRGWAAAPREDRDVHARPIPRLGGIAIVIAFMAPLLGLFLVDSGIGRYLQQDPAWLNYAIALFVGGLGIAILGIYDDLKGANAYQKLVVQIAVATLVWSLGVRIEVLGLFGSRLDVGLLSLPLTVVWVVGVINAMNLIDGLDGLASGVAFMAVLPTLVISIYAQNVVMMVTMAALGGAILGFLIYNFRPASVFMGDTGSMFLGFILATASLLGNVKSTAAVSMIAPVLALGLPIVDTLLAIFRRGMAGLPLFDADNDHVHHRLINGGFSHRQTVLVLYAASLIFAGAALLSAFANGRETALLLFVLAIATGVFLRKLGYLSQAPPGLRQRNKRIRSCIGKVCTHLNGCHDLEDVWEALAPLRTELDLIELSLSFDEDARSWKSRDQDGRMTRAYFSGTFGSGRQSGSLQAAWPTHAVSMASDKNALAVVVDALERFRATHVDPLPNVTSLSEYSENRKTS